MPKQIDGEFIKVRKARRQQRWLVRQSARSSSAKRTGRKDTDREKADLDPAMGDLLRAVKQGAHVVGANSLGCVLGQESSDGLVMLASNGPYFTIATAQGVGAEPFKWPAMPVLMPSVHPTMDGKTTEQALFHGLPLSDHQAIHDEDYELALSALLDKALTDIKETSRIIKKIVKDFGVAV